jgi:hypothetical protein
MIANTQLTVESWYALALADLKAQGCTPAKCSFCDVKNKLAMVLSKQRSKGSALVDYEYNQGRTNKLF